MFQIISDGGCDFTKQEAKQNNVDIVPFYITFDNVNTLREGIDINAEEFFKKLLADKDIFPKTSQPNPQDYVDIFKPYVENGKDIVCLTISSKVSGSYASAKIAKDILIDSYPTARIVLIDSLNGSIGQGLILKELVRIRDAGHNAQKVAGLVDAVVKSAKLYFTVDTLEYLKKGGRIGPTTAMVGNMLGIRPILQVEDGSITQLSSARGKKKTLKMIEEAIIDTLKGKEASLSVGHILREEEAEEVKDSLELALGMEKSKLVELGATMGAHAGPGAICFAYCKKYDKV